MCSFCGDLDGTWDWSGRGGDGLAMLQKHIEEYGAVVDELETQCYDAQRPAEYFRVLETIGPVNRAAHNLYTTLQTAREAIENDRELIDLRDQAYDLHRAAELLQTDARNGLDFEIASEVEKQAQQGQKLAAAGHRLNVLAAIFFPLTAITSVFGMSLPSGLENAPAWVFWAIFAFGLALGFVIRALIVGDGGLSKALDKEPGSS